MLYQNRWLLCTAAADTVLEYEFKGKRCHCCSSAQVKKKVLYGATDDIFLWDISDISAVCTGFSAQLWGLTDGG